MDKPALWPETPRIEFEELTRDGKRHVKARVWIPAPNEAGFVFFELESPGCVTADGQTANEQFESERAWLSAALQRVGVAATPSILWTRDLEYAADCLAASMDNGPGVRECAGGIATKVGDTLNPYQIAFINDMRSRFAPTKTAKAFDAAWAEAWKI